MSIRTMPFKAVINSIDANTVVIDDGMVTINIPNSPPLTFEAEDVVECSVVCAADCTPAVWTVKFPEGQAGGCECPPPYRLLLKPIPCPGQVGLVGEGNFNGGFAEYNAAVPAGITPTTAQIHQDLVSQINGSAYAFVTAEYDEGNDLIIIKERNCDEEYVSGSIRRTCGIRVLAPNAIVTEATPHVSSVYSSNDAFRDFPVGHGQFGLRADLTACGAYCKYYFKVHPKRATAPAHMVDKGYVTRELEIEIVVNSLATGFAANFNDELAGIFDCIEEIAS